MFCCVTPSSGHPKITMGTRAVWCRGLESGQTVSSVLSGQGRVMDKVVFVHVIAMCVVLEYTCISVWTYSNMCILLCSLRSDLWNSAFSRCVLDL